VALLARYSKKPSNQFIQYDSFHDLQQDPVYEVDEDGHSVFCAKTWELMHGSTVRVLIKPWAPKEIVMTLLAKITKRIDKDLATSSQEERIKVTSDGED
jgi:hypothetical protein